MTYKQQTFIIVLKAGKPKIQVPTDLVPGGSSLPGSQTAVFSLCLQVAEEAMELSLSHLPNAPPPNTTTSEIRFQHLNFGETRTFSLQHLLWTFICDNINLCVFTLYGWVVL